MQVRHWHNSLKFFLCGNTSIMNSMLQNTQIYEPRIGRKAEGGQEQINMKEGRLDLGTVHSKFHFELNVTSLSSYRLVGSFIINSMLQETQFYEPRNGREAEGGRTRCNKKYVQILY